MFASLEDVDVDAVLSVIKARKGAPGDVLFRQGDVGSTMMFIENGQLAAVVRQPSGSDLEVARFGPGEVVGEMALLDPAPRSATVTAVKATLVYEFSREALGRLRVAAPRAAAGLVRAVIRDVTRRLREINARIEAQLDGVDKSRLQPGSGRDLHDLVGRVRGGG